MSQDFKAEGDGDGRNDVKNVDEDDAMSNHDAAAEESDSSEDEVD